MFNDLKQRLAALRLATLNRSAAERDLDDEIRLHLDFETEKNIQAGHAPDEARRLALVAFGGVDVVKEAHRDGRGVRWFHELLSDSQFALRMLRRTPAFAVTAILTLGLGIGATTAIFSVVNAVVLRPLPFASPNLLVMMWEENPDRNWKLQTAAPANYMDWRDQLKSIESSGAIIDFVSSTTLTGEGEPRRVSRVQVTGGFFSTLGIQAAVGRTFREEETWDVGSRRVMLSYDMWVNQFGSRRDVVGRNIVLGDLKFEVIGVLPSSFRYPGVEADFWAPSAFPTANRTRVSFRRAHYIRPIGRMRDGVTVETVNSELRTVMSRLEKQYPETNVHMSAGATPLQEFLVGDTRRPLFVLLAAVSVLLLISCANVGNLLLLQAGARQRELVMRLALGASRARLIQQAITESVTLSVIGGLAGLAIGWMGVRVLASLQPPKLLPANSIALHGGEVVFAILLSALTGLLFGVAPALWNSRRIPSEALKDGGRAGSASRSVRRWSGLMVIAEVSMAVLLTVGAGLLVRSYWQLQRADIGFNPNGVMTMSLSLAPVRYDSARKFIQFYDELLTRTRAIPGVTSAAAISSLPATSSSWSSDFSVAGRAADQFGTEVVHREMYGDYTKVMQIKVLSGRTFTDVDYSASERVVLINEALARQFFANEDPIGKRVAFDRVPDSTSVWRTIVGVIGNERQAGVALRPRPEFIVPFAQDVQASMTVVVRTSLDPATLAPVLRREVNEIDPLLAISSLRTMQDVRLESVSRERFLTVLLLAFSLVGLVLAVVGVYGVMAQTARGRTREMGIRLALGAPARGVQWLIVRYGLRLTTIGLGIGLAAAFVSSRALKALLYEITPLDVPTFVMVPVLLTIAAVLASWVPAWRASRVDAAITLRAE